MAVMRGRPKVRRQPTVRVILNVPPELAAQIRALAERERRPLSQQVYVLLDQALALRGQSEVAA